MSWRNLALAALVAAGTLGAQVPGANLAPAPIVSVKKKQVDSSTAKPPLDQLVSIKRVYVERFGGGEGSEQIRDMVIATIQKTNLFALTENAERADALLRGSAEDLIFTENFQSTDGITARVSPTGSSNYTRSNGSIVPGVSIGDHESVHKQERRHEASASVRLVNRDGDVIWSTIQESQGAKFRSASADVAERISRQLVADYAKVREDMTAPTKLAAAPK
jgi:hypothetical protein